MMKRVDREVLADQVVQELGLDQTAFSIDSAEASAAILRRVAAFRCPCPPSTLISEAANCAEGLRHGAVDEIKAEYEGVLQDLQAYGDLVLDFDRGSGKAVRLLFLGPLGFTRRPGPHVLLHGVAAEEPDTIPDALQPRVSRIRHTRRFEIGDGEDPRDLLGPFGFLEVPESQWLRVPKLGTAQEYVSRLDKLLSAVKARGSAFDLTVLLPDSSVTHYRSRWTEAVPSDGRYVARRRQMYGASLWCYAEVQSGELMRFLDLPVSLGVRNGFDEAWALQAAIDQNLAHPQRFRIRDQDDGSVAIEVFGPVPSWIQRRWESVGIPATPSRQALAAYAFEAVDIASEVAFLEEANWMKEE